VTNVFQLNYESRLKSWYDLRKSLENSDIKTSCLAIDNWWQFVPIVNHYLHPNDIDTWPGPWVLLSENTYCEVARSLGTCYTLLLIGITDIKLVLAKNNIGEDVVLVIVHDTYVLNYWPNTVQTNKITDFTLSTQISINSLKEKIK
jgi:hypothetical protein